jgi:hypothetical protein
LSFIRLHQISPLRRARSQPNSWTAPAFQQGAKHSRTRRPRWAPLLAAYPRGLRHALHFVNPVPTPPNWRLLGWSTEKAIGTVVLVIGPVLVGVIASLFNLVSSSITVVACLAVMAAGVELTGKDSWERYRRACNFRRCSNMAAGRGAPCLCRWGCPDVTLTL